MSNNRVEESETMNTKNKPRKSRHRSPNRVGTAKPTLKDIVEAAHAAGMKVNLHLKSILSIEISRGMEADLNTLVKSGLFGMSASEAARRILEEWLWNNTIRIAALRPNAQDQRPPT